ncbi:Transcriptional regulator [Seminavis robusta]|uniref:Transcriptional regulator n=1 Tax=Seminavis robusta TaxID=568900 RepID=A0A9N8EZ83_9STRA|nr:Transcriptional regulator [Seminavis robusta]|eukprot:Sro2193_g318490.1 Transcriptional regulator (302) ;mRNA; r:9559-10793
MSNTNKEAKSPPSQLQCARNLRSSSLCHYPRSNIEYPGKHDVMLGRGGESNYHSGNLAFREFVKQFREEYQAAPRYKKPEIAMKVVQHWRNLNPPGRFLTRTNPDNADSLWHDVDDKLATKRALKNLGESDRRTRNRRGSSNTLSPESPERTDQPKRSTSDEAKRGFPGGKKPTPPAVESSNAAAVAFVGGAGVGVMHQHGTIGAAMAASHHPVSPVKVWSEQVSPVKVLSDACVSESSGSDGCGSNQDQSLIAASAAIQGNKINVNIPTAATLTESAFSSSGSDEGARSESGSSSPHEEP